MNNPHCHQELPANDSHGLPLSTTARTNTTLTANTHVDLESYLYLHAVCY